MVVFPPLTLFTDHWTAGAVPSDNTAVKTLVVPARTLVAPCTVMVSAGGGAVVVAAAAGEAATDPPHPASAAANKKIAAKRHHTRNRFGEKLRGAKEGSSGAEFKNRTSYPQGNSEYECSDSELLRQDVKQRRRQGSLGNYSAQKHIFSQTSLC